VRRVGKGAVPALSLQVAARPALVVVLVPQARPLHVLSTYLRAIIAALFWLGVRRSDRSAVVRFTATAGHNVRL
jgi:hypothetical protein